MTVQYAVYLEKEGFIVFSIDPGVRCPLPTLFPMQKRNDTN